MDGLIIIKRWLDKILDENKTWEIRGQSTSKRGKIALIQSGYSKIVGTCEIIKVIPLSINDLKRNLDKHKIPKAEIKDVVKRYKKVYAWVIKNSHRIKNPIRYKHPRGAVIWVKLPNVNL